MSMRCQQTQQASQFAVASELSKMGYEVSIPNGNASMDVIAITPGTKKPILIDVKGLYRMNPWIIRRKPIRENLFYILVFLGADKNDFFILNQRLILNMIECERKRLKRSINYEPTGILFKDALPYKNAWKQLQN